MSSEMKGRLSMVCRHCRGTNVRADAYAGWNEDTQQWEVDATYEKGATCSDCDGETRIDAVEVPGPVPDGKAYIWVAVYEEDGTLDVWVCQTEARALSLRDEVAEREWSRWFPDKAKPQRNIGAKFFEAMEEYGDAHFRIECEEVLP